MTHTYTKIWIHGILGTKDRCPLIEPSYANQLNDFIKQQLENDFNCPVRIINSVKDHIHILFLLNTNYLIKDIFKNIKGSSSHWINQNNFTRLKFVWQRGYGAFSVSESKLLEIEKYIRNQETHHKKMTFFEECESFLKRYGLELSR